MSNTLKSARMPRLADKLDAVAVQEEKPVKKSKTLKN